MDISSKSASQNVYLESAKITSELLLSKIYENIEKRNFNCCQNYAADVIERHTRCIRANIQARKRCAQNAIRRFTGF
jgi:hypothetical protein